MAAHVPLAPGLPQMLKEGTKFFSGLQETLFSNLTACKALVRTLRSCYGPMGHHKLVVNHLGKSFHTSHAATILRELEVENPVACLLRTTAEAQQEETGDGTTFVILLAGALLENAEKLLRSGISVVHIQAGYEMACKEALRLLPGLVSHVLKKPRDIDEVTCVLQTAVGSKIFGHQKFLARLVAKACVSVLPHPGTTFNPDFIHICKVPGGDAADSRVLEGMVICTEAEGIVKRVERACVAVYCCTFGPSGLEAKNTTIFRSVEDMKDFGSSEEKLTKHLVRAVAAAGINTVVVGGKVDDQALFYANSYKIMVVRLSSRVQLQSLCRAVGATLLLTLVPPLPEATGHCRRVYTSEIGSTNVVVFSQDGAACPVATVVLRGSTQEMLDCLDEAVRDGISIYNVLGSDPRLLPGSGATEMALAVRLSTLGMYYPGTEQYGILEFSQALKTLPATLAENAGLPVNKVMAKMEVQHQLGTQNTGIKLVSEEAETINATKEGLLDPFLVKHRAIALATQVSVTLLGVSEIMVARKAGGPKFRGENPNWDKESDILD
ncbi:T-complex protein 1 subunit theta-like [Sphaerodactylus townsendi]|uniref:T-complex protein 1 subunit theta-like n=1 Tax=Sphaerodactylus townsendi TaxID=933632 RepID=UPI002026E291|nr:T-complex protein 1 subunit theta-like [Sphaerodactylus townsendi]